MKRFIFLILFFTVLCKCYSQTGLGFSYVHTEIEEYEDYFENVYTIQFVFPRSPAEKSGLKVGDRIVKFHDALLFFVNPIAMEKIIKDAPATVNLVILRDKKQLNFTIAKADKSTYTNLCLKGNCANGKGTFIDSQGVTYTGPFKNHKKEGEGKSTATNGDSYEGQWKDDMMNGKGKFTYSNGGFYEGNFVNNNRSGKGVLILKDGTRYDGIWKDNNLNGTGTMQKPNGDLYTGNFVDSKLDGEITILTKATNTTAKANYKNGTKLLR
jgi:hypothetical protein